VVAVVAFVVFVVVYVAALAEVASVEASVVAVVVVVAPQTVVIFQTRISMPIIRVQISKRVMACARRVLPLEEALMVAVRVVMVGIITMRSPVSRSWSETYVACPGSIQPH
jgi:hypothetical protein